MTDSPSKWDSSILPNPCLLLVDVQQDFLNRPNLIPTPLKLNERLVFLLDGARRKGWPVYHIRTCIQPDGCDRMPHWIQHDIWACVAGSTGYEPPPELAALPEEKVLHKRFFSGFDCPELLPALRDAQVRTLVIAGLYSHGCIRSTVLDAYARGFSVYIAEDAIGSTEPVHAELGRVWLEGRAARFLSSDALLSDPIVDSRRQGPTDSFTDSAISQACEAAAKSGARWAALEPTSRAAILRRWAELLERERKSLIDLLAGEVGKPFIDATDEVRRTLAHIEFAALSALQPPEPSPAPGILIRCCPVGTLGVITPWNNPLAIPAGKLSAALAWGNACVWKPAPETPKCTARLYETLIAAGLPKNTVTLVSGGARTHCPRRVLRKACLRG